MIRLCSAALALVMIAGPGMAANARSPYANIDKRVDAGNDTGDSKVDQLNSAQLDQNYYRNRSGAPGMGAPMPPPAGYPAGMPPRQ